MTGSGGGLSVNVTGRVERAWIWGVCETVSVAGRLDVSPVDAGVEATISQDGSVSSL